MSVAGQLHQLQEIDLRLDANERAQAEARSRLGESQEVARLKAKLAAEEQRLEELRRDQHAAEWEVDDLASKVKAAEEQLFGGKIRNPKELSNLQRDVEDLKARRARAEDRALDVMDRAETMARSVSTVSAELRKTEAEWQSQQQQLSAELEQLAEAFSKLTGERQRLVGEIAQEALQAYQQIKARKGTAVARVEQGTCRGCQIVLPTTELQQVRGGGLVRCSSCGRILFLA